MFVTQKDSDMFKTIILATATLAAATAAQAADFTGPRIEARFGWDRLGYDSISDLNSATRGADRNADGVMYGIAAGYDFGLTPNVIAGIEVAADFFSNSEAGTIGGINYVVKPKRDFEVSGRIGTKLAENVLLYGKVGYSNARFTGRLTGPGVNISSSDNNDGWRVGAGLEFALSENVYAKAEYRYTNYEGGVSRNQVVTGLGLRF